MGMDRWDFERHVAHRYGREMEEEEDLEITDLDKPIPIKEKEKYLYAMEDNLNVRTPCAISQIIDGVPWLSIKLSVSNLSPVLNKFLDGLEDKDFSGKAAQRWEPFEIHWAGPGHKTSKGSYGDRVNKFTINCDVFPAEVRLDLVADPPKTYNDIKEDYFHLMALFARCVLRDVPDIIAEDLKPPR